MSDWISLASSLSLLSQCRPVSSATLLLIDQLEYLLDSQAYLSQCPSSLDIPSNPQHVSPDLWSVLHKLPLSVSYFEKILHSTSTHTQFWESLDRSNQTKIDEFPWKSAEIKNDSSLTGLEDLVILKCISDQSYIDCLNIITSSLLETVQFPSLESELTKRVAGLKGPLLLMYDQASLVSQVNHYYLKESLRNALKV